MPFNFYSRVCEIHKEKGIFRTLPHIKKNIHIDFTQNNYLSLSHDRRLLEGAYAYGTKYGVGGRSSRLLNTFGDIYYQLEKQIAEDKGFDCALLLATGYQANSTVISALLELEQKPLIFTDYLMHASAHQGIRQSHYPQIRFQHNNLDHLETLLKKYALIETPKFIFTETIFSTEGDIASIENLQQLAQKFNAFLYVDESHSIGILGDKGYGLNNCADLVMGSFGKALGVEGAYVACSKEIYDYLVNKCKGLIYSTAPSPLLLGAQQAAWDLVPLLEDTRRILNEKSSWFRNQLKSKGLNIGNSMSHIIPIIIPNISEAKKMRDMLEDQGILVSLLRPPTVPEFGTRLRLCICAHHTYEDLSICLNAFSKV